MFHPCIQWSAQLEKIQMTINDLQLSFRVLRAIPIGSVCKFSKFVLPNSARHPETIENTRFQLELAPVKTGAEITPFCENRGL
jgi:hypothetical protein